MGLRQKLSNGFVNVLSSDLSDGLHLFIFYAQLDSKIRNKLRKATSFKKHEDVMQQTQSSFQSPIHKGYKL